MKEGKYKYDLNEYYFLSVTIILDYVHINIMKTVKGEGTFCVPRIMHDGKNNYLISLNQISCAVEDLDKFKKVLNIAADAIEKAKIIVNDILNGSFEFQ